ncbi:MAG: porin [Gammaproteobacteria bacterium]|nr:porin [Gammaproteobacteria bacterium]
MKKRFLVIAIAAGLVSPLAANAEASVYGIAHAALTSASGDDSADAMLVNSNSSRVGVKGSEDLGGGMKAVYKMEFGVDITDSGDLSARNQYVGLSTGMGTVLLGRHDTPLKMVQGGFDVFNDTVADMAGGVSVSYDATAAEATAEFGALAQGAGTYTYAGGLVRGENRAESVIAWVSPKFGAIKAVVALVPGEAAPNDGIADGTSIGIMYDANNLYVGLGINSTEDVGLADQTRLTATYTMDALTVGFMYSTSDIGTADDEIAMGLSAAYKMGANTFKFQYIDTTDTALTVTGPTGTVLVAQGYDETRTTVGVDHAMSKATSVYALADSWSEADVTNISFGLKHNF